MDLTVQNREKFGKAVRSLRQEGLIPAEFYGHEFPNQHLSVPAQDFDKIFKEAGESSIINLIIDGRKEPALIHDVVRDRLTDKVIHIDFYKVKMDEKITAYVPLEFTGEAPAVKEKLGILNKAMSQIEVEALPLDLPKKIEADLSSLDGLDKNICVKDLKIPEGVEVLVEPETVVATIVQIIEEVEEKPVEVQGVKVEGEEKKAERDKEKEKEEESKKKKA